MEIIAYCLCCKEKVVMIPIEKTHTKHNRYVHIGLCSQCGSRVSVIRQENHLVEARNE